MLLRVCVCPCQADEKKTPQSEREGTESLPTLLEATIRLSTLL